MKHSINRRKVLTSLGGVAPVGGTRADLAQKIRDDSGQWARVIKAAGFVAS